MANEWNTHLDSLKDRLSELNQTIDDIKSKVEKRPGLDAATRGINGLISSNSDKSLAQYPVVLSNVLSDSAIGAIMLNAEGKFMMFNFTAQRILGIAYVSRMCGATDTERQEEPVSFLKSDDTFFEERELPWKRVLEGIEINNFRLKVKKDAINDIRWINISATPFADANQQVSGGIVFLFDFTDEVNLETSINSLCGVIAGQISQVGNSQRELEQLANQLAQTGIQKILLEKGIQHLEASLSEPKAVAPVPDLSQRARFQPETLREAAEEGKKSEETPGNSVNAAQETNMSQDAKAQEFQTQAQGEDQNDLSYQEDIDPWPEEADSEDFNKPLWEEYGKQEEESAQAWTKNLDEVVSEVIQQESSSKSHANTTQTNQESFVQDEEDIDEDEDDEADIHLEIDQDAENEIHVIEPEQEITVASQITDIEEVHEIHEVDEVQDTEEFAEIEEVEEISDTEEVGENSEFSQIEEVTEFSKADDIVSEEDLEQAPVEFEQVALGHDLGQEVENFPNMDSFEEALHETVAHAEELNIQEPEFDEFEPIDQILSLDDERKQEQEAVVEPESFEPAGIYQSEQYVQPETHPEDLSSQTPPPPAVLEQPETPAILQQAVQEQESPSAQQEEDFSNIASLVQKPSLKDTLLGGKKKRSTSASMHRIKAMSGATELSDDEEQSEQTVVDYGAEEADSDLNIKKVLVVDDIPVNQKLLLLHLRRLGYDADVASNGQEALDALADKEYELILMDCDMPVMNGFEAAARIRSNESYSHRRIPIIALTSYDREGDRERCIAAGMDDYITKGASRKELKEAIKRSVVSAREKGQAQSGEFNLDDIQADIAPLDIKAMLKLYGKEEVEEISRLFLSNMGTYIECMQLAIDEKDADSVVHFANAVKGPCAALGMKLMTRLTTDIITYSEAKDWTQVRVKYMRLKAVFVQTREELKKVCPDDSLLAK